MRTWVDEVNTTNLRILVSVLMEVLFVSVVLGGVILGKSMQVEVLYMLGGFIIMCLGLGNWQFRDKRMTDTGYIAAKQANAPSPVNVESPSEVNVTQESGADAAVSVQPLKVEARDITRSIVPKRTQAAPAVQPLTHRESEAD